MSIATADAGTETVRVRATVARRLYELHDDAGQLTEAAVVADAEHPDSPLHRYFEWDDTAAAVSWRLRQAGDLIRRVRIVVSDDDGGAPITVRAFVARVDAGLTGGGYGRIEGLVSDRLQAAQLQEAILSDLRALRRKWASTSLFAATLAEFDAANC